MERRVQETVFTKMSSKGQVVIPARIRKKLEMREGSVLAVTAQKDMIVLKRV
jgi:AbrB family looped-hinge helix DNA binding protein